MERVCLNGAEDVLSPEQRWEVIVDEGKHCVAAKFPRMVIAFPAQRFRKMEPVLASLARKNRGPSKAVEYPRQAGEWLVRVALRPLQVAGKLRAETADCPDRNRTGE